VDRALSFFGLYDVFGYLASGASVVIGAWWISAGELPPISVAGLVGLFGAAYIAGQLMGSLGHTWERKWWKHAQGKPYVRAFQHGEQKFGEPLRAAIAEDLAKDFDVAGLSVEQKFNLARTKLRILDLDGRAEAMRAIHGLCRNLTASTAVLLFTALGALFARGCETRLLVAAGVCLVAIPVFLSRTLRFERRFGREIWLGYIALRGFPGRQPPSG
jgi:hypothetical protein